MPQPEAIFKRKLIRRIEQLFPGAIILKNDANYRQGIPDHIVLYGPRWAIFDAKSKKGATHQPNQDYYIDLLNEMSFASFVDPQDEEEFLYELQQTLRPGR